MIEVQAPEPNDSSVQVNGIVGETAIGKKNKFRGDLMTSRFCTIGVGDFIDDGEFVWSLDLKPTEREEFLS